MADDIGTYKRCLLPLTDDDVSDFYIGAASPLAQLNLRCFQVHLRFLYWQADDADHFADLLGKYLPCFDTLAVARLDFCDQNAVEIDFPEGRRFDYGHYLRSRINANGDVITVYQPLCGDDE